MIAALTMVLGVSVFTAMACQMRGHCITSQPLLHFQCNHWETFREYDTIYFPWSFFVTENSSHHWNLPSWKYPIQRDTLWEFPYTQNHYHQKVGFHLETWGYLCHPKSIESGNKISMWNCGQGRNGGKGGGKRGRERGRGAQTNIVKY